MAHHARAVSANRIFALAGAILTLVFVFMVSRVFDRPTQMAVRSEVRAAPAYDSARAATTLDTDADGMPDWEEALLGTDQNNADENGNGVMDGKERDQFTTRPQTASLAYTGTTTLPATLTDAVAHELIGTYMEAFRSGEKLDASAPDMILKKAADTMDSMLTVSPYTEKDVHAIPTSNDARLSYIESVRVKLFDALEKKPNEYAGLNLIVHGAGEEGVRDIQAAASIYKNAATELQKLSVPEDAVQTHIQLMNGLTEYAGALEKIAEYKKDPILATIGINSISVSQGKFTKALGVYMRYTEILGQKTNGAQNN